MSSSSCFPCCLNSHDESDRDILDLTESSEIPVKRRKQTDLQYLIILAVLVSFLVICVGVAGGIGDVRRLLHGYDDNGNLCGCKNEPIKGVNGSGLDYTEEKYLQITKYYLLKRYWTVKQCVKICKYGYGLSVIPRCNLYKENMYATNGTLKTILEVAGSDLFLCWKQIVALCFFSICLSGLFIWILQMFAKKVICIVLVTVSIVGTGLTIFAWIMYSQNSDIKKNSDDLDQPLIRPEGLIWLIVGCFATALMVVFLVLLIYFREKISLVAAVFQEAIKCVNNIPTLFILPVLTNLAIGIFECFTCVGLVCLQTSGRAEIDSKGVVSFPVDTFFQITTWLLLFVFLWIRQFLLACQNLVIAGSASSWYFSRVKGKLINPVWRSFCMIVKHHLGSAAFGSLLLAIIKSIQIIYRMFRRKASHNALAYIIYKVVQSIFVCLEHILKTLTKSAYVMIALSGKPFCSSARQALKFIIDDPSRIALVIEAGTFIILVVEILISFSVTFVGITLFMSIEGVQFFWVPAVILFILSYLCCHCFFTVYDMAYDTMILCFCVEHQMNNDLENPYYVNSNLMVFLNKEDRTPNELDSIGNGNKTNAT